MKKEGLLMPPRQRKPPRMFPEEVYQEFEPHIRELVRALNMHYIETVESCEGHLKGRHIGTFSFVPHVVILASAPRQYRDILQFMHVLGIWNTGHLEQRHSPWVLEPLTFEQERDELDAKVLYLRSQLLNPARNANLLAKLQQEAEQLAEFLKDRDPNASRS